MALNIVVFGGSVRTGRNGSRLWNWIIERLALRGHTVTLFDPLELKLPLLEKPFHHYPAGQAPQQLAELNSKLVAADAFVIVTGEYNHAPPPALLNTLDHFGSGPSGPYAFKPFAITSYSMGPFAGMRAAIALRPVVCELGAVSINQILAVPSIQSEFGDDNQPKDANKWNVRLDNAVNQLEWWAVAAKTQRASVGLPHFGRS
eukprot:TRINITY_DN6566_c0_g1_i1.p1 TRINITY_DN6566_c0_g1~~TRINITY_DN6566_c0_g1_i1.p1  ORF type:complete len:203 (+),score=38.46 TRINITY_DN6566_c0_g1_i1:22-630(+)